MPQNECRKDERISRQEVQSALDYDAETGILTWRHRSDMHPRWNGKHAGKPAGGVGKAGRWRVKIGGKFRLSHRIIWLLVYGEPMPAQIDHINGNPLDNRLVNLRAASHTENQRNKKMCRNNQSGRKGVSKSGNKWMARIRVDGKLIYLGRFNSLEDAAQTYARAAKMHFGSFARV